MRPLSLFAGPGEDVGNIPDLQLTHSRFCQQDIRYPCSEEREGGKERRGGPYMVGFENVLDTV